MVRLALRRGYSALFAIAVWVVVATLPPGSGVALARSTGATADAEIAYAALPREAQQTLQSIKRGGPYAFERDGIVFGNYEHRLPQRSRGYYHEYTVPTPGARNRGARRIIAGAGAEYYYTDDHYRSFRRIRE